MMFYETNCPYALRAFMQSLYLVENLIDKNAHLLPFISSLMSSSTLFCLYLGFSSFPTVDFKSDPEA